MLDVQALSEFTLAELFQQFPGTIRVFLKHRMACVGCDLSAFETVAEAVAIYGLDTQGFCEELGREIGKTDSARRAQQTSMEE